MRSLNTGIFRAAGLMLLAGLLPGINAYAANVMPVAPPIAAKSAAELQKECQRVKALGLLKGDVPSAQLKASVRGCKAERLYYPALEDPKATKADWDKVRACAVATNDNGVMMMLYANGFGVRRNYGVALKYACGLNGLDPDYAVNEMLSELTDLKASSRIPERVVDYHNYATTVPALKARDAMEWDMKEYARVRKLDLISRRWGAGQKAAFAGLRLAAEEYAQASSHNETDQSGVGKEANANEAYAAIKDDFLHDVERSENRDLPNYTQAKSAEADKKLDQVYQVVMHPGPGGAKPTQGGGITRDGIEKAQRAWLKYRDAWVAFGKARYPAVPDYAWKARLAGRRAGQLQELAGKVSG